MTFKQKRWTLGSVAAGLLVCGASHPGVVQHAAHPCRRVAGAIRSRFLGDESVDSLADDFNLPVEIVRQIVQRAQS
jgi:hypothetical protein